MLKAYIEKKIFKFKEPGGTSRGVLLEKVSFYIVIYNESTPEIKGVGECSILPNLSPDDRPNLEEKLNWVAQNINSVKDEYHSVLQEWPAIIFAVETAFLDLKNGGKRIYFDSPFLTGGFKIPINGLIWMGDIETMQKRIEDKIAEGFRCLKLKIGALEFEKELELIAEIRKNFSEKELEIRLDANGAFDINNVSNVLDKLAPLSIHSIEQPIKQGQWRDMKAVCEKSPIDIALDEELIGVNDIDLKKELIKKLKPHYIILKPSLHGGINGANEWISIAEKNSVKWWITSALESNVGLEAIDQWSASLRVDVPQGLGTGQVFEKNIESNLKVENGMLFYSI